jgi:dienelactone hydrolase
LLTEADVTGSSRATRGIFLNYDVFGLFIQSIKGADILASDYEAYPDGAGDFKVFMPDFWGDHPQDLSNFPPKTPKQTKAIIDFMTGPAEPSKTVPLIDPLLDAFQKKYPQITSWSTLGFCWGVKICTLVTAQGTKFKAAAGAHPSLMNVEDAKKVVVPTCILPSQDEDPEVSDPLSSSPVATWPGALSLTISISS